jgi:hypothetical protein
VSAKLDIRFEPLNPVIGSSSEKTGTFPSKSDSLNEDEEGEDCPDASIERLFTASFSSAAFSPKENLQISSTTMAFVAAGGTWILFCLLEKNRYKLNKMLVPC